MIKYRSRLRILLITFIPRLALLLVIMLLPREADRFSVDHFLETRTTNIERETDR
jgi:hypothetical protein